MLALLLPCAFAVPCPPPEPGSPVALSPDGAAHLLTSSVDTACWWVVDDNGDGVVARHFELSRGRPTALRWDDRQGAICIDVAAADGTLRTRVFPAPALADESTWGHPAQAVR